MRSLVSEHARHSTAPPPPFSGDRTPSRRRIPKENVYAGAAPPSVDPYRSPSSAAKPLGDITPTLNRALPPRPLNRKLDVSPAAGPRARPEAEAEASDSGVQVVVRIRPPCSVEGEEAPGSCLCKTSANSVSIQGQSFTFDAVADAASTQEDFFTLVGPPLVENCLAGLNSSIFTYGQTGSGKTYTMWGPLSAISGDSVACERGLAPRVFEHLFSRIKQEQGKHKDKELICSCTCSFLEIYNEQITDLLDPMQKNLQIREDVKTACVYVESLTKESVFTMKDVTQLLVKGLANRRTGSTSANADLASTDTAETADLPFQYGGIRRHAGIRQDSRIPQYPMICELKKKKKYMDTAGTRHDTLGTRLGPKKPRPTRNPGSHARSPVFTKQTSCSQAATNAPPPPGSSPPPPPPGLTPPPPPPGLNRRPLPPGPSSLSSRRQG